MTSHAAGGLAWRTGPPTPKWILQMRDAPGIRVVHGAVAGRARLHVPSLKRVSHAAEYLRDHASTR